MNIFILRHGIAGSHVAGSAADAERPLTDEGRAELRRVAAAMEQLKLSFEVILSSPYKRAHQTAELVAKARGEEKKLRLSEHLTPAGSARELIDSINDIEPRPDSILLVGHEPHLSELISFLISGQSRAGVLLKKAGLAKLGVDFLKYGRCAELRWLLTPKQMTFIARG